MIRSAALAGVLVCLGLVACGEEGGGGGGDGGGGKAADDLLEPAAAGRRRARSRWRRSTAPSSRSSRPAARPAKFPVKYESLDDSTAQAGGWEPGATSANARKAASATTRTIGYIGEFNSGATAVSLPILNEAGVAQVSPGNTAVGITSDDPGAEPGEPDKYYPTGKRTYARVLPEGHLPGRRARRAGQGGGLRARPTSSTTRRSTARAWPRTSSSPPRTRAWRSRATTGSTRTRANYRSLGQKVDGTGAECFIYSGITANNAVQIFKDMAVALPDAPLLGPEGVGETGFFDPEEGGLPADVAKRVLITIPGVAPEEYPPAGKEFLKDYTAKYGEENPDRYAVYGYESMSVLLDAIKRAGDNGSDRAAVVEQLLGTKDREGVFGKYSIDENGDITLTPYGVYKIEDGAMVFDRTVTPES